MGKQMTENKKEKWKQVLQLMRMLFTRRRCNVNVGGIKANTGQRQMCREVACEEILIIVNLIIAKSVYELPLKNLSANCLCKFFGTSF